MIHCECCGAGWSEGERLRALQTPAGTRLNRLNAVVPAILHTEYDQKWHEGDEGVLILSGAGRSRNGMPYTGRLPGLRGRGAG